MCSSSLLSYGRHNITQCCNWKMRFQSKPPWTMFPAQELSTRQRSEEWGQTCNRRLQEADKALELTRATLLSHAGDVQKDAAELQHWLDCQQAVATEPEAALTSAGMAFNLFNLHNDGHPRRNVVFWADL